MTLASEPIGRMRRRREGTDSGMVGTSAVARRPSVPASGTTKRRYLSGAAGELGQVLCEGQGCEFEAFHRREIREDDVAKIVDREPLADGKRGGLNAVAAFLGQNVRAQEPPALAVGHELDEPARVARRDCARDGAQRQYRSPRLMPGRARAASVSPTLAICGSVNMTIGIAAVSYRELSPSREFLAATVAP